MNVKSKKIFCPILLVASALLCYFIWVSFRPVEIVAVHEDRHFSDVLVKDFPITDKGKIAWWLKNKDMLKGKYNIPKPSEEGYFTIVFWLFGDGYKKEGKYDRLCFDDMKPPVNCIDKNRVFSVSKGRNYGVSFTTSGGIYRTKENGEIVKDNAE